MILIVKTITKNTAYFNCFETGNNDEVYKQ